MVIKNQVAEGPAAVEWTAESIDCNFTTYLVTDGDFIYVGAMVEDDNSDEVGPVWEGDGIDFYMGFFDAVSVHDFQDKPWFRFGYAVNPENEGENVQVDGYAPFQRDGLVSEGVNLGYEYIVEMKIPLKIIAAEIGDFTLENDMMIPMRMTVNDDDGPDDPYGDGRSMMLTAGGGDTENAFAWQEPVAWRWWYVTDNPSTDVADDVQMPLTTELKGNYPNPFNPTTTIEYDLAQTADVKMIVYDAMGREVQTLVNSHKPAGQHTVIWDGLNQSGLRVSSGVYFVKFQANDTNKVRKIMLLK